MLTLVASLPETIEKVDDRRSPKWEEGCPW